MRLKQTSLRLTGAAMIAAAVIPWLGGGTASALAKADADTFLKASQVPTTAEDFSSHATDCPGFDADAPFDYFHFVLDGDAYHFTELTADFSTGEVTITSFGPPSGKHAYVQAPAGATLEDAWASVELNDPESDAEIPADFQLSHTCVGTPGTTSSSPPVSSSSPPVSSSSPPVSSSSAPPSSSAPASTPPASVAATTASQSVSVLPTKVENTTATEEASPETSVLAESEQLPHTGGGIPYTALVVLSLGLLLAGGALLLLPGLSVERANRRH